MLKNTLKEKLNANQPTVGPFVNSPAPSLVESMGWLGFDFVIIDCEHGSMDYETAENMIRAAELSGITPIIRIGMNIQQHIQRYLDAGAHGVLIPLINNAADGKAVVDSVKYPPVGKRGMFGGRPTRYGLQDTAEYLKEANENTFVGLQIETLDGIENQDEIIATEGADLIFLGPGDLSTSFGYPGQPAHPKVIETIEGLTKKILAAGKHVGTITADAGQAKQWNDIGIRWHVSSTNRFINAGGSSYLNDCKAAFGS
jgi:4-hydroxy-2-oxoheptanedioate aldolase